MLKRPILKTLGLLLHHSNHDNLRTGDDLYDESFSIDTQGGNSWANMVSVFQKPLVSVIRKR